MPIRSITITFDGNSAQQLLPDDKSRRWYVIQNASMENLIIGGEAFPVDGATSDGLILNAQYAVGAASPANGGTLEVTQSHENDKTPCHAVRGFVEGSGGDVKVIWATEDSTD